MKFVKILIALLAFPMVMEAAEQGTSWWCSFTCGAGSEQVETPEQAAARAERERMKAYYRTHRADANIAVHTRSQELDRARITRGLSVQSPSHIKYKEKMRTLREVATEVQAEQAGVTPEVWTIVRDSTDARNRRPGQVYHAKDMVALAGAAVPKAPTIERTASMSAHNPENVGAAEHDAEKERRHHVPVVFTFADAPKPTHEPHLSVLALHNSAIILAESTPKLGQFMAPRPKSARLSVGENPLPAAEQADVVKLQLPGQVVEADAQSA